MDGGRYQGYQIKMQGWHNLLSVCTSSDFDWRVRETSDISVDKLVI